MFTKFNDNFLYKTMIRFILNSCRIAKCFYDHAEDDNCGSIERLRFSDFPYPKRL